MYTLHIKGDLHAAFAACQAHKLEVTSIVQHFSMGHTIASIKDHGRMTGHAVIDWYCETTCRAPFPVGTLLFYSLDRHDNDVPAPNGWDIVQTGNEEAN